MIEIDAEFAAAEVTPAPPVVDDPCFRCDFRKTTRIQDAIPPPGCEREARRYADLGACISTQAGDWALCAAKTILRVGHFEWYFGIEKRTAERHGPPPGMTDRRARLPPPTGNLPRR